MKALLVSAFLLVTAISALAQGQVIFQNRASSTITNVVTGLPASGGPAQDDIQVGLYVGNVGDPASSLSLIGPTTNCFAPGRFAGGTRTLAGWTGIVQLQVRAWLASTVYPSYEAAFAAGLGDDASVIFGVACPQFIRLGNGVEPPPSTANGDADGRPGMTSIIIAPILIGPGDPGVVCPVPEPSSVALGVLGLGVLLLLRRKK